MGYNQLIKQHLADYKSKTLGIRRDGMWKQNNKHYPHILPEEREILNILPAYREDFCEYFDNNGIKLHQDFHHLNSSQAMCFNLFFPFLSENKLGLLASDVLSLPENEVKNATFEKVLEQVEGTNFDFFMEMASGSHVFFELKLSESNFGAEKPNANRKRKLDEIYHQRLTGMVAEGHLHEGIFFQHYQILRNISYLRSDRSDVLFLIFPRENEQLARTEQTINGMLTDGFKDRVRILYLEELVERILQSTDGFNTRMGQHYHEFKRKYIPEKR
jgi:hypothetical protein